MNSTEIERGDLARFGPALFLLFLAMLINYVDRGSLSVAAPLLKQEWHISASSLGLLLSAFFWSYTAMQFVSGWLVDRFGAVLLMGVGYALWSLATAATGLVTGFTLLFAMRLLLGIGESVIFPASAKILATHLPEETRGFANGVICAGMKAGPAVGTFAGGILMASYGWRHTFIGLGLVSLLWLPAWRTWRPVGRQAASAIPDWTPTIMDVLRQPSFWGASAGHFCTNYVNYFLVVWLPFYLVNEVHLTMRGMARTAGVYYLIEAATALTAGSIADVFIRRGHTASLVRKSIMALGCVTSAAGLCCCAVLGPHAYQGSLLVVVLGGGIFSSGVFAMSQTLAGPLAAGQWVGLQNALGNFAGIIGPALTGLLVERTGNFTAALTIAAGVVLVGAVAWVFMIGPLREVTWETPAEAVDVGSPA